MTADGVLAPDIEAPPVPPLEPSDVTALRTCRIARAEPPPTQRTPHLTYNAQAGVPPRRVYGTSVSTKSGRLSLIKHFQGIAVKSVTAAEQNDTESCCDGARSAFRMTSSWYQYKCEPCA